MNASTLLDKLHAQSKTRQASQPERGIHGIKTDIGEDTLPTRTQATKSNSDDVSNTMWERDNVFDGAVRLNRFGFEKGKTWPAIILAILVLTPALLWTQWNAIVSGEEELTAGTKFTLTSVGTPDSPGVGTVEVVVPDDGGWTTDTGNNRSTRIDLIHGPAVVEITAVAGVNDIDVLFDRQRRDLSHAEPAMMTTSMTPYETSNGLSGHTGTLIGERYSGLLTVVGKGRIAVIVVAYAPLGQLDSETEAINNILATLEVSG